MDGWMNQREKEEGYYNLSNIFLVINQLSFKVRNVCTLGKKSMTEVVVI